MHLPRIAAVSTSTSRHQTDPVLLTKGLLMAFLRLSSGARGHSCGVLPVVQNLILLSLLLTTVYAQDTVLIPTTASDSFPACGLSCSALQQAQSSCVYPQAPKTDRATYVSCFCQSALLTNLHSGSNGPCDTECTSSSDRSLLSTWYNNFCNAKGNLPATTASSTTTSSTSASTANTGASANNSQDDEAQPWYVSQAFVTLALCMYD